MLTFMTTQMTCYYRLTSQGRSRYNGRNIGTYQVTATYLVWIPNKYL